ncbi:MAG: aromatic ring-hydroxylating dioxygenase subunit alpha [Fibrobacterota bacterium]|nr:aromatic ring-hydroxylating dioxygenase subunit alpha [Fibrobacterota bacterium]
MKAVPNGTLPSKEKMIDACGGLREHWYAAALSWELTEKRPLGRIILERPLVLWRTTGGDAIAMEDRCAHRNAPLSEGQVFDGRIGCPYHGWVYDREGRCVSVPSEGPDAPPPSCKVPSHPVRERHGLIWVWMGEGEPSGDPFPMPYLDAPGWGAYYMATEFANEVTHLVENFMDVPHTRFVHFGWFRKPSGKRVRVEVERTPDSVLVTYHLPEDKIGFAGRILNPEGAPTEHTDRFYMPNTTRVDYTFGPKRGFTITSTCTPRGPFDTMVYTLISYKLGWLNALAPAWLPFYTRKVIRQDVDIMRIHGDNLRRFGRETRFHSTPADLLHEFIESLRDHSARRDPSPPPAPRTEEVFFWI